MNKRESVKYDLISAINVLELWNKFDAKISSFVNTFSDSVHVYNIDDIDYVLDNNDLSYIDIVNIGKRSSVELPKTGWFEVVYNNGKPFKITKVFKISTDLKQYLLDDIDELTDFIIDNERKVETFVPWQHKIYKIIESLNSVDQNNEAIVQMLEDYIERNYTDQVIRSFINTLYEQIKQQELELNKV